MAADLVFSALQLQPVAVARTPYNEKFAVPRQPDLVLDGSGIIELLPPYNQPETVRGLEQFSHLWLIFQFDRIATDKWQPTVRPPRLGGNRRVGVFASRATHRPNPIGLSKVRLDAIQIDQGKVRLQVGSIDLVNGTPILDIKPYLAYADSEPNAVSGFAQTKPSSEIQVRFAPDVEAFIQQQYDYPNLQRFIRQLIEQDPRPAYQQQSGDRNYSERIYGISIWQFNVRFRFVANNSAEVVAIEVENRTF
ncbi:tRNA (N6-threonylcarbamoyladenosine(37)-N6)-methyltransferase TrmO [Testudinibacter aquarius]|uniref:tRNA (N6-threonylcarbamoyladenosine(37)-N6)-methyltransferase TrmO n=1 Tax=Testudinibacter aquarius TaxID=1524974 RepID=A0A4R3YC32_9PAST|nr:tRNA (N6-threonylcarbamoyladenosine(37)-N6)-methyltransferase TrmO [Testudinibacter aquarius]KAE9529877.1 tRNA (N6-threonylcarbamoyladenosine(37)-N6)-methyltransferase TrmO [Testudinibacter aquarius]TCV89352.1 tRNA-Thr(GGU) m(6)t(6)A37 methyltransferase TsaA [Testudinibacter aquarius]TNG93135.1 tRNA (N6-threonylcarbamoyladenosine(37)-N6)-methyltransferase TrmO [Testudinibacter aquarius]